MDWRLDRLFVDGSSRATCSRVDGGMAEDSSRLLCPALGESGSRIRMIGRREVTKAVTRLIVATGGIEGPHE